MLALNTKDNTDYIVSSCWWLTFYSFLDKVITIVLISFLIETWPQPLGIWHTAYTRAVYFCFVRCRNLQTYKLRNCTTYWQDKGRTRLKNNTWSLTDCWSCKTELRQTDRQTDIGLSSTTLTPFDAHCCHAGTAIKHPVPDGVKPSFVIFDIRALWHSGLSLRVPVCQKLQMTA